MKIRRSEGLHLYLSGKGIALSRRFFRILTVAHYLDSFSVYDVGLRTKDGLIAHLIDEDLQKVEDEDDE